MILSWLSLLNISGRFMHTRALVRMALTFFPSFTGMAGRHIGRSPPAAPASPPLLPPISAVHRATPADAGWLRPV
jgi:hypothetical protein